MRVTLHTDFASLASQSNTWNELAGGVPFRRWEWCQSWWQNYACDNSGNERSDWELFLLGAWSDDGQLIGIAPWYRRRSRSGANSIHFLGDGEVCSDYCSILCRPEQQQLVTQAIADWLSDDSAADDRRWDRLQISGVDAEDAPVNHLLSQLRNRGNNVHFCKAMNTWRVALPATWDEYLMVLSKPHRNRLRQLQRKYFETGRVTLHQSLDDKSFNRAFEVLIHLHQGRWERRGMPGCFASDSFETFHREASQRLIQSGAAELNWLEMDGMPLAAEYLLVGNDTVYAYQSGIDMQRLADRPGHLANMASMRRAIERGKQNYDLLRGDEPYKAHWRAQRRPMLLVRVVPPRASARVRHNAWLAGQSLKQWIKHGMALANHWTHRQQTAAAEEN